MRPTNGVDTFRNAFFDKLIEEETKKQQEEKLIKATCFHTYVIGETYERRGITYQYRTCSKCGHSAIKRREVWEGTKGCTIS